MADDCDIPELSIETHGGNCCGIRHLSNFYLDDDDIGRKITFDDKLNFIATGVREATNQQGVCMGDRPDASWDTPPEVLAELRQVALECVLDETQWRDWERALHRSGFRRVFEFRNSNSGHRCRVYYMATNQPK